MKPRSPHTGARKGKRVLVVLRDGTRIEQKFIERTDKYIFLEKVGKIAKDQIKSFTIFKKSQ